MSELKRKRLECPECGTDLRRVHRRPVERWITDLTCHRRYACSRCGWTGLRRDGHRSSLGFKSKLSRRLTLILLFAALTLAVAVPLTVTLNRSQPATTTIIKR